MYIPREVLTRLAASVVLATPAFLDDGYQVGAILEDQWGYEQTNIDYYRITKRSGWWVTLEPIGKLETDGQHWPTGTCVPDPSKVTGKPFRRKLRFYDGRIGGLQIDHGWCTAWDGRPSHWTAYA